MADQPAMTIDEPVATGWLRSEFYGDSDKGQAYLYAARKQLGALKTRYGVNERVAQGEPGGYYHDIRTLPDGTQIETLTNDGHDTVRITVPTTESFSASTPVGEGESTSFEGQGEATEFTPELPVEPEAGKTPIEEYLKPVPRILGANFQTLNVVSMETDEAPILEKEVGVNSTAVAGGLDTFLLSISNQWRFYDRDWNLVTTVLTEQFSSNVCAFVDGNYYTFSLVGAPSTGTPVTVYSEAGQVVANYQATGYGFFEKLVDIAPDPDGVTFWVATELGTVAHYDAAMNLIAKWDTGYGDAAYLAVSEEHVYVVHDVTFYIAKYTREGVVAGSYDINNDVEQISSILWLNDSLFAANTVYSGILSLLDTPGITRFDADLVSQEFFPIGDIFVADALLRADYGSGRQEFSVTDPGIYGQGEVRLSRDPE